MDVRLQIVHRKDSAQNCDILADVIVSSIMVRLMRLITLSGVYAEVGDQVYAATDITELICKPGMAGGEKHYFDLFFPIRACLMDYIHETGFYQFPAKSDEKSPFEYTHKSGFFEFFEKSRDQRKYFDDFMSIRREGLVV
ncbi:hypothetical protein LTR06_011090 [Exophiala xenobiotica]|nr:hypothetical protein LTR06_011090 [Exophiala xenobiotica]